VFQQATTAAQPSAVCDGIVIVQQGCKSAVVNMASSSAVAVRPRDALCPAVVSLN